MGTNLEVTSSVSFCLFLHCFEVAKSFLWWLLTRRFWSLSICNGPFSLVTMYAPLFTVNESRNYFVFEVLTLHVVSWWQNPFFFCYWCFFWCSSIVKHIFCHVVCMLLISLLANLKLISSLMFCLFVSWRKKPAFDGSLPIAFKVHPFAMVSFHSLPYMLLISHNESRSYFIFEVMSLSILFNDDKIHCLMVADPSLLEICFLRRSAFAC